MEKKNIGNVADRLSRASFVWLIFIANALRRGETRLLGTLGIILFLALSVAFLVIAVNAMKNADMRSVKVDRITPADDSAVLYACIFIWLFAVIWHFDLALSFVAVICLIISVICLVDSGMPNPLFVLLGYHFYQIQSFEDGKYVLLMSKRKLRNINQVKRVKNVCGGKVVDAE